MLKFTSTRNSSPEKIMMARESGHRHAFDPAYAYQFSDESLPFTQAASRLTEDGSVLYAIRLSDGIIKIGWTSNLCRRWRQLVNTDKAEQFLGFTFGSRDEETELHRQLSAHVARGREYYHPHSDVLEIVNNWRSALGREPIAV